PRGHEQRRATATRAQRFGEIVQHIREAAVLDEELLAMLGAVEKVERAADRRPPRRRDRATGVHRRREKIGVRTPVSPEVTADRWQRVVLITAAKQKLRRAERAGGEHHDASRLAASPSSARVESRVVHSITAA